MSSFGAGMSWLVSRVIRVLGDDRLTRAVELILKFPIYFSDVFGEPFSAGNRYLDEFGIIRERVIWLNNFGNWCIVFVYLYMVSKSDQRFETFAIA